MKTNASSSTDGCSAGATSRSSVQLSAVVSRPTSVAKSKYASTVPANASAMPTEPMSTYFHDASTEALLACSGISSAEVMVVASIATHMKPTLSVVTANSMVAANRLAKMRKRRACAASQPSSPRPGPNHAASAPTTLTQKASSVDSASARRRSSGPATGTRPASTSRHSPSAAPTVTSESTAVTAPTAARYGRTTSASSALRSEEHTSELQSH